MNEFNFDENGFLKPAAAIPTTIEKMEEWFVEAFPFSEQRGWLFENYLKFVSEFQRTVFPYFVQWIDGSFVTQKQDPGDIDIVTFLDYRVYRAKEKEIERFLSFNMEDKGLDTYFAPDYPLEHERHFATLLDKEKWLEVYSNRRQKTNGIIIPKGFLELTFEKEIL